MVQNNTLDFHYQIYSFPEKFCLPNYDMNEKRFEP